MCQGLGDSLDLLIVKLEILQFLWCKQLLILDTAEVSRDKTPGYPADYHITNKPAPLPKIGSLYIDRGRLFLTSTVLADRPACPICRASAS